MASQPPLSAETTDKLLKALLVLSRTVDQVLETRAVATAANGPLSKSKVQILRLLGQRSSHTASQVARYLGVTKPAVSQIIDSMVAAKLVVRRSAKQDRREVHLDLTKKGREVFRAVRREQRHILRAATRLSPRARPEKWIDTAKEIASSVARADHNFEHFCLQCGAHEDGTCVLDGGDAQCLFLQHAEKPPKRAAGRLTKR